MPERPQVTWITYEQSKPPQDSLVWHFRPGDVEPNLVRFTGQRIKLHGTHTSWSWWSDDYWTPAVLPEVPT